MRFWFGCESGRRTSVRASPRGWAAKGEAVSHGAMAVSSRRCSGEVLLDSGQVSSRFAGGSSGRRRIVADWTRRNRLGWNWPSADPPLGESAERYRVTVQGSAAMLTLAASEPRALVSADSLNGMSGAVTISVVQIKDFAESRRGTANMTI